MFGICYSVVAACFSKIVNSSGQCSSLLRMWSQSLFYFYDAWLRGIHIYAKMVIIHMQEVWKSCHSKDLSSGANEIIAKILK